MKIQTAEITPYGSPILIAIVDPSFINAAAGNALITRIQPHFPLHPIMLIAVEENGFRAHAHFQTHLLLALIQLENLTFTEVDLSIPARTTDDELPF